MATIAAGAVFSEKSGVVAGTPSCEREHVTAGYSDMIASEPRPDK
ncbi:hypothetical protein [Sulfitobacter sp.]|jgi:hypothetical protein